MRIDTRALVTIALIGVAACATTGGLQSDPLDQGISRTFTGDYDRVLKSARESVVEAGLAIENVSKVDDKTWMIIGKKGASAWSWGEMVRVVVQETGPSATTVRVLSKRKLATNVAEKGDYSDAILSNVELKLK